jgi:hypothetical protein
MRPLGSDGKRAAVQVHQSRMRPRPFRLQHVQSQPLTATAGVCQILNQPSGGHALLHARQEVDKAGRGAHADIHRDPPN